MENQYERTLAYQTAYEIDIEELEKVSGGSESFGFTTKETVNPYGGDVGTDVIW
ncbi:MAG: hypothetical protein Q8M40_07550 [Legionella sp.]|nr:hypothetical protein [Legionella sp.]